MKKILLFTSLVLMVFVSSCNQDPVLDGDNNNNNSSDKRIITITACIPDDSQANSLEPISKTRVKLDQDELNVKLTWQEGDKIDLCIEFDDQKEIQKNVEVINIREDGKK